MRPIRAIIYGLGTMGRMSTRLLRDRGVEVLAGYVRTIEGRDFSAPELQRVEICRADTPFEKFGADIALITHCTRMQDLYEPAMRAAKAGLDALTIAEDAFDPFFLDDDLKLAHELDAAFRAHGKTLASVGVQDTFWFAQPLALTGAASRIDRIIGRNIADWGAFGTDHKHPVNLTAEAFAEQVKSDPHGGRGIFMIGLRPLIRALGLEIRSVSTAILPVMAEQTFSVPRFDLTIQKGKTRGLMEKTVFQLERGIVAEGEFIMTFLPEGETAFNEWIIEGSPTMNMRTDNFIGDIVTAASLVNRVRDVMDAEPGLISVDRLRAPRYWPALSFRQ